MGVACRWRSELLEELEPAFGGRRFFFEGALQETTLNAWLSCRLGRGAAVCGGWRLAELVDRACQAAGEPASGLSVP